MSSKLLIFNDLLQVVLIISNIGQTKHDDLSEIFWSLIH